MIKQHEETVHAVAIYISRHKRAVLGAAGVLGSFLAFEVYFLRELLAAELLFGLCFVLLSSLLAVSYLIGTACERGFDRAEARVHELVNSTRRVSTLSR